MAGNSQQLGRSIQEMRKRKGLTQDALSDLAGLSYSTLAKIERGAIQNPSIFTITALMAALGCTIQDLIQETATPMPAPKIHEAKTFFYCDINGVLVRFFQKAFVKVADEYALNLDKVESLFWHYNDAANRGEMSLETFNVVMAQQLGIEHFDWQKLYMEAVEPIRAMHECIAEVSKTHGVGLLSNTHQGFVAHMIKTGLIPDIQYDAIVDSSEVGAIKPEPRIYEIAERLAGASGSQILFVDDSRANLIAAERFGWRVLWFDDFRPSDSVARVKHALKLP